MVLSYCSFLDLGKFLHPNQERTCRTNPLTVGFSSNINDHCDTSNFWVETT